LAWSSPCWTPRWRCAARTRAHRAPTRDPFPGTGSRRDGASAQRGDGVGPVPRNASPPRTHAHAVGGVGVHLARSTGRRPATDPSARWAPPGGRRGARCAGRPRRVRNDVARCRRNGAAAYGFGDGSPAPAAALVRPDGYLSYRSSVVDVGRLLAHLSATTLRIDADVDTRQATVVRLLQPRQCRRGGSEQR
jgi:hypothetical protein